MSSGVHKIFDKKRKTTDFENYICLFKKHTQSLVMRFKKVVLQRKPGIYVYNWHLHTFPGPFLKKKKNFQAPRTKGEKVTNSVSLKDKNVMKKKY